MPNCLPKLTGHVFHQLLEWPLVCLFTLSLSSLARCVFQSLPNFNEVVWYNLSQIPFQMCVLEMALVVKNPLAKAEDIGDVGLTPGLGWSPGGRCGNPLQYSYRGNPMDKGAWKATVHRVTKSRTWLKQLSMHAVCALSFGFLNKIFHRV